MSGGEAAAPRGHGKSAASQPPANTHLVLYHDVMGP
jgi:hypothetical protein